MAHNQRKLRSAFLGLTTVCCLIGGLTSCGIPMVGKRHNYNWKNLTTDGIWKYYSDENYTSRLGVDLSQWNDTLDWDTLCRENPIEFAILKIGYRGSSEGGLFLDPLFEEYYAGAVDHGMDIGVYFFSQSITVEEAVEEADFIIDALKGRELQLPVAFDFEVNSYSDKTRIEGLSGKAITEMAVAFCNRIEEAGYTSMVYTNRDWIRTRWDMSSLEPYGLWIADWDEETSVPYEFQYWQYAAQPLAGAKDTVDLNLQLIPLNVTEE